MKNLWSEILVPAAIVALTMAGTVGVETSRSVRIGVGLRPARTFQTDTIPQDTVRRDSLASVTDTLALTEEDDFDFFNESEPEQPKDTLPRIFARDTMKVPESLRDTDPFLYRWYVAVKDSLTHRMVIDSLRAAGDSLDWPVIDSLYYADSTAAAKERFRRWYEGLSKEERKKYDRERKMEIILHRQDSIQHIKDSLKHIKDSIRENTPRVLETAFLPDSLYFKRLVAWQHERHFNRVEVMDWDTTFNHHFHDYPYLQKDIGGNILGMPGSAVQTYNFFKREDPSSTVSYYQPYESWTYSPSTLPMFNTKTPYTELSYYGNLFNSETLANDDVRIFTTQNISPAFNFALEFKTYGGAGVLKNSKARNKTAFAAVNYLGKKYLLHAGVISNTVNRVENGGIIDNMWIRDTTVDVREINVSLTSATNKYTKRSFFLDQTYRIPFSFIEDLKHRGDTTYVRKDTLNTDITTFFIGTSSEYSVYNKYYSDNIASSDVNGRAFYRDQFFIHPTKSADSLHTSRLDNRIFARFQPWREDAVVSKVEGGIGDRLQSFHSFQPGDFLRKQKTVRWNSLYAYAGAEGRLGRYMEWDALGQVNFAGAEAGDFFLRGNAKFSVFPFHRDPGSPISLTARFETNLKEPDFYEQRLYSNHFWWDNEFSKVSTTRIQAAFDIPKWKLHASAGYALLANNIYYDSLGVVRQNTEPMSILTAMLRKDIRLGILHLENSALFQLSSREDVVPLPKIALNLRYYLQFPIVAENVLKMQLGVDARYNTLWYSPGFNPVSGTFYNQHEEQYGNTPYFDVFMNLQWKQACIFLKMENVGQGWPMDKHDYFSAHHYIYTNRVLKFGIWWPFYPPLNVQRTMSSRASSGGMGLGSTGGGRTGGRSGSRSGGSGGRQRSNR